MSPFCFVYLFFVTNRLMHHPAPSDSDVYHNSRRPRSRVAVER